MMGKLIEKKPDDYEEQKEHSNSEKIVLYKKKQKILKRM